MGCHMVLCKVVVTVTVVSSADYICDPLIENPAHPAFYENRDKTENRYTDV